MVKRVDYGNITVDLQRARPEVQVGLEPPRGDADLDVHADRRTDLHARQRLGDHHLDGRVGLAKQRREALLPEMDGALLGGAAVAWT